MTSTPDIPAERAHLDQLREDIDELKGTPTEDLVDPKPETLRETEPTPVPTDSIGNEDWNDVDKTDNADKQ